MGRPHTQWLNQRPWISYKTFLIWPGGDLDLADGLTKALFRLGKVDEGVMLYDDMIQKYKTALDGDKEGQR